MPDYIFLRGAQGTGKTTIARLLKARLAVPHIDFDWIRDFHLNATWSNRSATEWAMSVANLIFLLQNYTKHGFRNVIVSGLMEPELERLFAVFNADTFLIFTLYLTAQRARKPRGFSPSG